MKKITRNSKVAGEYGNYALVELRSSGGWMPQIEFTRAVAQRGGSKKVDNYSSPTQLPALNHALTVLIGEKKIERHKLGPRKTIWCLPGKSPKSVEGTEEKKVEGLGKKAESTKKTKKARKHCKNGQGVSFKNLASALGAMAQHLISLSQKLDEMQTPQERLDEIEKRYKEQNDEIKRQMGAFREEMNTFMVQYGLDEETKKVLETFGGVSAAPR